VRDVACPICLEVMVEPVTTTCGHSFDRHCLHQSMRGGSEGSRCPVCRCAIFGNPTFRVSVLLRDFIRERAPEEFVARVAQLEQDKVAAKERNTLGLANVEDLMAELNPASNAVDAVQVLIAAATQRGGTLSDLGDFVGSLSDHHLSDKQAAYNLVTREPEALEALKALLDMDILDADVIDALFKPLAMRLAWWGQRPGMELTTNAGEYRRAMCDAGLLDAALQLLRKAVEDESQDLEDCRYMDTLTAYALDMSLSDHCHQTLVDGGICAITDTLLKRERADAAARGSPVESEDEDGGEGGSGEGEGEGEGVRGRTFRVRTNRAGFLVFACFNAVSQVQDDELALPEWMGQVDIATYIRDAMQCNIEGHSFMGFKWSNEEIGVCTYSLCVSERFKAPLGRAGAIPILAAKIARISDSGDGRSTGPSTPLQSYWFVSALLGLLSLPDNARLFTNADDAVTAEICAQALEILKMAATGQIDGVLPQTAADAAEIVRFTQGTLARATSAPP